MTGVWPGKHAARALLGYVMDARLAYGASGPAQVCVPSPWDAWWACYRARLALRELAVSVSVGPGSPCRSCARRALHLAAEAPPDHPGTEPGSCDCLMRWAAGMRAPGPLVSWPPGSLSLALIKPGAPARRIRDLLAPAFEVLTARELTLTTADTRRLYPEAYGASYVQARDAYMTSAPVQVLTLRARQPGTHTSAIKTRVRGLLGGGPLRNHLHMPDNPGETLADIAHLAGYPELAQLYRRYEREHTAQRLVFYRAALGIGPPGPDRLPAAG